MRTLELPRSIYVPTYVLPTASYQAAIPPNESWREDEYGPNSAVVDTNTVRALDQTVVGPVLTWDQLDATELAIRAIVLHERLYWLQPAILVVTQGTRPAGFAALRLPPIPDDNGHVVYPPPEEPQAIMDLLRKAEADCYAVYSTWIYVRDGKAVEGDEFWIKNYQRLLAKDPSVLSQVFRESFEIDYFRDSYFASPKAIGAGSYFGSAYDRQYEADLMRRRSALVPEEALRLLDDSWRGSVSGNSVGLNVRIGPFLAIVLSRAKSRSDIPNVVLELRAEFFKARTEFWQLLIEPLTAQRHEDAVRKLRSIERAVQSVVPATFRSEESPFSLLWGTTHAIADIAATGGTLSAIKYVGEILLKRDVHLAQASTIEVTKRLVSEIKNMNESLIQQLRRHLSSTELSSLGIPS